MNKLKFNFFMSSKENRRIKTGLQIIQSHKSKNETNKQHFWQNDTKDQKHNFILHL